MPSTRSSVKANEMAVTKEIKDYFTQLVEPLATNDGINEMFSKFQKDVLSKISKLETKISEQDEKISVLESSIVLKENVIRKLTTKCDDNEQYSRRSCLRIHGVEYKDGVEDVNKLVKECYKSMNLTYYVDDVDRAHRIGNTYVDQESGKQCKSIIVKFVAWESRTKFYKSRPKAFIKGQRKPGPRLFSVSLDITKRRYELLKHAKGIVKHYPEVSFAFADVNCSLGMRLNNNTFCYFNDEEQLDNILSKLKYVELDNE